jgi:hypothetical protein
VTSPKLVTAPGSGKPVVVEEAFSSGLRATDGLEPGGGSSRGTGAGGSSGAGGTT